MSADIYEQRTWRNQTTQRFPFLDFKTGSMKLRENKVEKAGFFEKAAWELQRAL